MEEIILLVKFLIVKFNFRLFMGIDESFNK